MSGLPNPEGIDKVRNILLGQSTTEALVAELRARIKRDTDALKQAEITYYLAAQALEAEMKKMDLTQSGNTGHERRMHAFLLMLTEATVKGVTT